VPAAAFWTAGHLLRRRADDVPARTMDSLASCSRRSPPFLEIRHFVTTATLQPLPSLAELGMQVLVGLAWRSGSSACVGAQQPVHGVAALIMPQLTLLGSCFGLLIEENP